MPFVLAKMTVGSLLPLLVQEATFRQTTPTYPYVHQSYQPRHGHSGLWQLFGSVEQAATPAAFQP
jgi:hypothetical protein